MFVLVFAYLICFCTITLADDVEFEELYNKWWPKCRNQHVARLNDGSDYLKTNIPWSLNSSTIHDFVRGNGSPYCTTVDQLMESVTHPVTMYPCRVPWLSLDEICETIQGYSYFVWSGDSLMRHMIQALLVILKQDFRFGGYPARNNDQLPYMMCECDGQFSEARVCRNYVKYNYNEFFSFTDIAKHTSKCSQHLSATRRQTEFISDTINAKVIVDKSKNYFTRPSVVLDQGNSGSGGVSADSSTTSGVNQTCSSDPRPVFFLLQGGAHYSTDPKDFIESYLQPYLHSIHSSAAQCAASQKVQYRINIVVSGVITCAPKVVEQFKHQSNEHAAKFYAAVHNYLAENYPSVKLLNLLSLTSEGINRSDGFHSFTDINLLKAMMVLNAMKLMLS